MFGGKNSRKEGVEYSLEAYKVEEANKNRLEEETGKLESDYLSTDKNTDPRVRDWREKHTNQIVNFNYAILEGMNARLALLKQEGHAEALKLNAEYDELIRRVEEAMHALEDFKINKLAMPREEKSAVAETKET